MFTNQSEIKYFAIKELLSMVVLNMVTEVGFEPTPLFLSIHANFNSIEQGLATL